MNFPNINKNGNFFPTRLVIETYVLHLAQVFSPKLVIAVTAGLQEFDRLVDNIVLSVEEVVSLLVHALLYVPVLVAEEPAECDTVANMPLEMADRHLDCTLVWIALSRVVEEVLALARMSGSQ